ncbi:MAG: hypothetical protein JRG71_05630 [Deltaproteobacteria bacterium]|nr:hypothetical protein [Deltaproteobacteria bacterium]
MSKHDGELNTRKLRKYLEGAKDLPYRDGQLNKTAIARDAGLKDRQPLYNNEQCVRILAEFNDKLPARTSSANKKETATERKNRDLETKNAELYAENQELRRQLQKLEHIESLIITGRRYQP